MKSEFRSVADMFVQRVEATPDRNAYSFPSDSGWDTITWKQTHTRVKNIALGLKKLGIESEQRVGILSSTRVEWILADLGIMCSGAACTTIYPSNTAAECEFILTDSETRIVFAEDDSQVAKLVEIRGSIGDISKVIVLDGTAGHDGWVITLDDLETLGREHGEANVTLFDDTVAGITNEQLATLIYTSGTTGKPKGVELLHDCWVYEGNGIDSLDIISIEDHQYLWLPLSHSFGKVLIAAQLKIGFLTSVDGRVPKLVENLGQVKPTFMAAAPRIFEKVYNKVVTGAKAGGGLKYAIFNWSVGVGRQASALRQKGREPSGLLGLKFKIANKLVFSKLKTLFGGNIRFFVSGSAPLSRQMAEFFHAADILILEGYGLTESSAATCVNTIKNFEFGTVGPVLPGTEIKIAESDGEVLLKGRGIMRAYHNRPDATAEALTEDGWLRTGDIGEIGASGLLKITDRKKDLIKTSGGKYVAPQNLEGSLKAHCPYLSQVVVHGNNRNFCTALVTLDEESIKSWKESNGLEALDYAALSNHDLVQTMVQEAVDNLNSDLASYESIKKFAVLDKDFSIEDGELTPSMKVKRKAVELKYKGVLDKFYDGSIAGL